MMNLNDLAKNCKDLIGKEIRIWLKEGRFLYGRLQNYLPKDDIIQIVSHDNVIELLRSRVVTIEENI